MPVLATCRALAPAFPCQYSDQLLYLAPSIALALLIRALAARHPFFFLFTLAGTVCHELAHFCVGLLTGARPASFSVIPRRSDKGGWELGSVLLTRVRWFNAAPSALAPFLLVALPLGVVSWRVQPGWSWQWQDIAIAFLLAPQWLSVWPSWPDWRIALRSWPAAAGVALLASLAWLAQPALFQIVKA